MDKYGFKLVMKEPVDNISYQMTEIPQCVSKTPFQRLLSQAGLHDEEEDDTSVTLLHSAAKDGDYALVKQLVEGGADVRARTLTDNQTPFHIAVRSGSIEVVQYFLDLDRSFLEDQDSVKLTPLHLAVANDHPDVVELLVQRGANLNARTCLWLGRLTPIEVAAREGSTRALECLLDKGGSLGEELGQRQSLLQLSCQFGHVDCVALLLKCGADPLLSNNQGLTSIDLAINNGHRRVVHKLLDLEKWVKLMTHAYLEDDVLVTPMRKLIRSMPDVAEKVFDKCIESGEKVKAYSYELLEDRSVIHDWVEEGKCHASDVDKYLSDRFKVRSNHPLSIMVNGQEEKLLAHPLVTSLLSHKWRSFARYFYYAHLLLQIVFLVFMTSFALTIPSPYEGVVTPTNGSTLFSELNMSCTAQEAKETLNLDDKKMFASSCSVICLSLITFNAFIEFLRIYRSRLGYFKFERVPKWVLLVSCTLFLLPTPCSFYKEPWQWSAGIIAIFFAWLEFTLSLRRLSIIGIYIVMFVHTLETSFKVVCALLWLMFGFAISFYMSLNNHPPFTTMVKSLLKSTMWMTGEFEYDSVFNGDEAIELYYPVSTYILFILFVIFMTILFMNLLVALAIDDIKEIQSRAELTITAKRVDLALTVEAMLPSNLTKKIFYFGAIENEEPGKMKPKRADIKAVMHRQDKLQEEIGNVCYETDEIREKQEKLEEMVSELTAQNSQLHRMMVRLLEHNGLSCSSETDV